MTEKKTFQSNYVSLQLMEIENFRRTISEREHKDVSFQDAMILWLSHGYAEAFRNEYDKKKIKQQPALA